MNRTDENRVAAGTPAPNRRVRRALVVACYLGYAGMVGAWALLDHPWRWLFVVPLGLCAIWAMGTLLAPAMLGVSDGADADLDERQIQSRNRAYLWAYRTLGASVMLAALYYMIATDAGWWLPRSWNELQAFFWGVWLLAATLPTAILAWTEADPPPSDAPRGELRAQAHEAPRP